MDMFHLAVINDKFLFLWLQWCLALGLLAMNHSNCSYDSFTASRKPAEEKVDILIDTKVNIIQQVILS